MYQEIVYVFSHTHDTIGAEDVLTAAQISVKVMPLPAIFSSGCGICLRISPALKDTADRVLQQAAITPIAAYTRSVNNSKSTYVLWEATQDVKR